MPTLNWLGKDKVINHHLDVPLKALDAVYTWNDTGVSVQRSEDRENVIASGSEAISDSFAKANEIASSLRPRNDGGISPRGDNDECTSQNKIIHGDNLEALKALLPEYAGRVDCIYIDPPYNTGNEGWVYNDNVGDPRIKKWLGQVVGPEDKDFSRHDKWLCMMYPRLKLLHSLLADTGVIFISIDDNEQANLKLICDEIFGERNFVNCFIWQRNSSAKTEIGKFTVNTEYVLLYAKSSNYILNNAYKPLAEASQKLFKFDDNDGRGKYQTVSLQKPGGPGPETTYDYVDNNGKVWKCPAKGWRMKYEKVKALENDNRLILTGNSLRVKDYWNERENEGKRIDTLWNDLPQNTAGSSELKNLLGDVNFTNPKPSDLIKRCIQIASSSALVLDSFAGSGTTAHAVINLNREDGGNRHFILIEMMDYAESITAERVKRVMRSGSSDQRAVVNNQNLSTGHRSLDTDNCFTFYELGEPFFVDGFLNEKVDVESIKNYVWWSETHSKKSDEIDIKGENEYFLGKHNNAGYWFFYKKGESSLLDEEFLRTMKTKCEEYIIYADACFLSEEFLEKNRITFKKIPRDIQKM